VSVPSLSHPVAFTPPLFLGCEAPLLLEGTRIRAKGTAHVAPGMASGSGRLAPGLDVGVDLGRVLDGVS